jgi:hypothetical protein
MQRISRKGWPTLIRMAEWSFLTNHARALICVAHDPGARLRDIAATLGITERRAFGIVTDLIDAGPSASSRPSWSSGGAQAFSLAR